MGDNLQSLLGPDTCRLCLKTGRSPTPVSNENLEGSLMAIKIDILTSVKVAPSDKVCPMCRINVKNFYDFRIMCVQSDARIKGFASKVAQSENDLSQIKSVQVVRSYKRVRRTTGEVDKPNAETINLKPDSVKSNIDLFKSTADLLRFKANSGNSSRGLFKLKTKPAVTNTGDVFKTYKPPSKSAEKPTEKSLKSSNGSSELLEVPLQLAEDPLMTAEDSRMTANDPLMSTDDPLAAVDDHLLPVAETDPLSSALDPLSSQRDPLSTDRDPLSTSLPPSAEEDVTNSVNFEKESCPPEVIVKIENTLEDESISDSQSENNDQVESDGCKGESETETDCGLIDHNAAKNTFRGELNFTQIKEELKDFETTELTQSDKCIVENMEEVLIKPEEVIIPEVKKEIDEPELMMEIDCDDLEDYSKETPPFNEESVENIKDGLEEDTDNTESLEVLVDPLMLMEYGPENDAQMENRLSRLSPVLGNGLSIKNGRLPLPPLNGARTDKQRGLDFVKQLLRKNDQSQEGQTQGGDGVEKPFKCSSCDISFAYYKSYVKHRDRHLGMPSTYACPHCAANFSTNRELHVHMRKHTEKAFSCDRCYRSFPTKERLLTHYSLHTGDKPHVCDLCKKTFAYKSSFVFHMKKQHGEVISGGTYLRCPKCPTEWSSPSELKQHMEMHDADEIDSNSFSCAVCSMTFPSKSILNVHARIHQNLKSLK